MVAASGAEVASAATTTLPGPADLNRVLPTQPQPQPPAPAPPSGQNIQVPSSPSYVVPEPPNAKSLHFILHGVDFKGVTAFSAAELDALYQPYVGKDITLDTAYGIAAALTERYRHEGYFLSRAFIPAQDISDGTLKIQAVEGYIGEVSLTGDAPASTVISRAVTSIKVYCGALYGRPARLQTLERQLLLLNDLPGYSFQATLEPVQNRISEPAVRLILTARKTKSTTTVSIDNGGSRYIGPYETAASWSGSLLSMQQTDLSVQYTPALGSPDGHLYAGNVTQKIMLSPAASLDVTGGYSNAVPGYTLKPEDITSQSSNGGIGFNYNIVRQRDANLSTRLSMDFRDSASDILNTVLSRDRIRAMNIGLSYDDTDAWFGNNYPGHNALAITFRHGLPIFNSNSDNDPEASRPDTSPDFAKLTANYNRLQNLAHNFQGSLTVFGQKASQSLYSSEEFGYGGMAIGRAYDTSEISGDSGISGSLEARYQGLSTIYQATFIPYAFYDIGKVWSYSTGQPEQISAASAGPGIRIQYAYGLSGDFYAAKPLTKPVSTPLYGDNGMAPRYVFQITDRF
jgi:hemolysin activation/secretion protein